MKPTTSVTQPGGMEVDTGFDWGLYRSGSTPSVTDKLYTNHGGGINVAYCDGHSQFLRNGIDVRTYVHLMTPYDKGVPSNSSTTLNPAAGYSNLDTTAYPIPILQPLDELDIGG